MTQRKESAGKPCLREPDKSPVRPIESGPEFEYAVPMPIQDGKSSDKYIKALTDISRAITSDLFLEDLLKLIVMVTAKGMDVDICSLWLVDEDEDPPKIRLKATQAIAPEYLENRVLELDEGVVGHVVTNKKALCIKNVLRSRRFKEKAMARKLGLSSMIGVPLQLQSEKVIGALNCFTSEPYDFSDTELNLMNAVANQAAVAILNTELMVKTRVIEEELETRKMVERAKETLMQKRSMSGEEAHRWMQKRSMDSRKSLRQIAEAILISEDLERE